MVITVDRDMLVLLSGIMSELSCLCCSE